MKSHPDSLRRFLFEHAPIRGERVHLDTSWRSVLKRHDYPPLLRQMMGELTAAAVLLAATLKLDGSLLLQIQGTGQIKLLVVECSGNLKLRATAKWEGLLQGSLSELFGDGRFVITLVQKDGKPAYQGIVELEGESVAEILQNYLSRSEQLETRLWLAADENSASGMLLQKLPDQAESDADAWSRFTQLADTLRPDELMQLPTEALLHRLFHEEDVRLFEEQPVSFHCTCTRDNVAQMLQMFGIEEVEAILTERQTIEVHCEFCNHRYEFDKVDAAQIFSVTAAVATSEIRH
ncbi:MAG: Hsp33 family molecular chaperone HslO [Proteobacteria bacterium]|nr:Hsp33 family molecular chaperone HslO [Pseudomonadota bacterium]